MDDLDLDPDPAFKNSSKFISHPLLKDGVVERREYQVSIAEEAKKGSLMVVLPTGLGKTTVALLVLVERLAKGKILFLAPTRPLVEQHAAFLKERLNLDASFIQTFTGSILPERRAKLWESAKIVVATPQIIENDLLSKRITLGDIALLIFDECHRAVGNYSYVYIAEKYATRSKTGVEVQEPLVLGMTASPGSDMEKIREICTSLGVAKIESRTEYDHDVSPYIFKKGFEWRGIELPIELKRQKRILDAVLVERVEALRSLGFIRKKKSNEISQSELLALRQIIDAQLAVQKDPNLYKALSVQAELIKIRHAIDLIETQGVFALRRYFERLRTEAFSKDGSKAAKRLLKDIKFVDAMSAIASYDGEHPKLNVLIEILQQELSENPDRRIIAFTNYRDTAEMIMSALRGLNFENDLIRAVKFIGQASKEADKGLTQKEQVEIINKFNEGVYNVLIATSVAEEGLDIPATDLVLFYEPIPSAIRSIQRKGRTARKKVGKVIVLLAKGTKDEAYYWLSRNKEREMRQRISEIGLDEGMRESHDENENKNTVARVNAEKNQKRITEFESGSGRGKGSRSESELDLTIFVDSRETKSEVTKFLDKAGVDLKLQNLGIGDYVISERVCIERKRVDDFLESLINKRRNLLEQILRLKKEYEKPLLIIEGESLYGDRNVHPNVVRAVMAAIAIDLSVPIIQTRDEADTASLLYVIAKREQRPTKREINPHGKKPSGSLRAQQEYLVSALPNIGIITAKNLLTQFKTVERILTATKEELMEVDHVGEKTAGYIKEVLSKDYSANS